MRIEFLGTAASEGFPDPFCECDNCQAARREGGPSLRKRSAAIINDDLLIDMGPDILSASYQRGSSFARVRYGLQTHPHSDHLEQGTFFDRRRMCQTVGSATMDYYASQSAIDRLTHLTSNEPADFYPLTDPAVQDEHQLRLHLIEPWQAYDMGPYEIQTVKSNHDQDFVQAMVHAIREVSTGTTLFYCTDTGPMPEETWPRLAELGWRFDLIAIDFTMGFGELGGGHMNHVQVLTELEHGRAAGVVDDQTRVFATHLAHHSNPCHSECVRRGAEIGIEIAYDGLVVEV